MTKRLFLLLSLSLAISFTFAKNSFPTSISVSKAYRVISPILMDSTDLKGKKFDAKNLLSTAINFPEQNQFTTELKPDSANFFTLPKVENGKAFQLISLYISSDKYSKSQLKVTSPQQFELYLNDSKKATKSSVEDSLKLAGSQSTTLNGRLNGDRVVVKMLLDAKAKLLPMLKIEITQEDSLKTNFHFSTSPKRRMIVEDVLVGKRVNSVSASPSGRYALMTFSDTDNKGKTEYTLEVFDTQKSETIFSEKFGDKNQLGWMPNADLLRFFLKESDSWNLYTLNPENQEVKRVAENLPKESFIFSPDGKYLYFSKSETIAAKSPKGLKRLLGPDDRQSYYRYRYFIYQYQLESGISQQITFGQNSASIADITADGRKLLVSTSKEDLSQRPFSTSSMYIFDVEKMSVDTLWSDQRFVGSANFSPDGKRLIVTGGADAFNGIGNILPKNVIPNSYDTQAFIFDIATKKAKAISRKFDPSIDSQWWSKADNNIYFRVQDKDCESIYQYNVKSKRYSKLPLKEELIQSFSLSKMSGKAFYVGSSTANSRRAYTYDTQSKTSTLIADPYASRLKDIEFGEVKKWTFKSKRGDVIDGRVYYPPNFDKNKKYPMIVYYYGGTSPTQRTYETTYPLHVYAANDYVVYALNPSGTTGYGQKFAARHVNAWGDYTAEEIIEGVTKFADTHSFILKDKIGNIGASYGGFMTQYLLTQTDIFAAAVSHAGISSISSYWGEGYWGYTYSSGASAGSFPWNNRDLYVDHSPLFNADKVTTPLLLLHGTADTNVPTGESIQMYNALKLLNKPVELVLVDGENHIILQFEKRINWNHTIYAWFDKWLKGDDTWWNDLYKQEK